MVESQSVRLQGIDFVGEFLSLRCAESCVSNRIVACGAGDVEEADVIRFGRKAGAVDGPVSVDLVATRRGMPGRSPS